MRTWTLAKSLVRLRDQINAAFPDRSKESDGSVGDLSHAARVSDHNPNAAGFVCAIDITHDPEHGVDGRDLSRTLTSDKRTKYVIFGGMIWKARTGKWEPYRGPNKHNHHVHISVIPDSIKDDTPWEINPTWVTPAPAPVPQQRNLKLHDFGPDVRVLQKALGIEIDGTFGYRTERAVVKFQQANALKADGIVGPDTRKALGL